METIKYLFSIINSALLIAFWVIFTVSILGWVYLEIKLALTRRKINKESEEQTQLYREAMLFREKLRASKREDILEKLRSGKLVYIEEPALIPKHGRVHDYKAELRLARKACQELKQQLSQAQGATEYFESENATLHKLNAKQAEIISEYRVKDERIEPLLKTTHNHLRDFGDDVEDTRDHSYVELSKQRKEAQLEVQKAQLELLRKLKEDSKHHEG